MPRFNFPRENREKIVFLKNTAASLKNMRQSLVKFIVANCLANDFAHAFGIVQINRNKAFLWEIIKSIGSAAIKRQCDTKKRIG